MIAASLPSVVISPLAGSIIDRHNKIVLMFLSDFIRMVTLLTFAYLFYVNLLNITILIIGTVFISISSSFFNPASMSILPQLVDKEDITKANATGQISTSASSIIGPLFGSTLIAFLGVINAFLASGLLFFISVVFLVGIKEGNIQTHKIETSVLSDMVSGFKLIKKYNIVSKLLPKLAILNFFFSSLAIVTPILAKGDAVLISYYMSSLGMGMLFSSLLFSSKKLNIKPTHFLLFCLVVMGISFMCLGFFDNSFVYVLSMFVIGVTLNSFNIVAISIYQRKLPQKSLGKIMALVSAISISLQPISYGVMGIFIEWVGILYMLLISGFIISFSAFGILKIKGLNEE